MIKRIFPSIISGAALALLALVVDLAYGAVRLIKYMRRALHRPVAYWLRTVCFYAQPRK